MSSAHVFLPVDLYLYHGRKLSLRRACILCLVVALICAASVFAILYRSDQGYPVAAVRVNTAPQPLSYAVAANPAAVSALSGTEKPAHAAVAERRHEARQAEPVARKHEELLALERTGARTYVEFSLARSRNFRPVGPVEICLWRTDPKHGFVQASVLYKERRIDFKRLKLNERVSIPLAHSQNLELVVNRVTKNQI